MPAEMEALEYNDKSRHIYVLTWAINKSRACGSSENASSVVLNVGTSLITFSCNDTSSGVYLCLLVSYCSCNR